MATRRRSQTKEEPGAPVRLRSLLSAALLQPPSVMKRASTLLAFLDFISVNRTCFDPSEDDAATTLTHLRG